MDAIMSIFLILYLIPTIVAALRNKRNILALFALNLFLGWTFLGWVVALVWALIGDPPAPAQAAPPPRPWG